MHEQENNVRERVCAVLVKEEVLPAFLLLPADYKEADGTGEKTRRALNRLQTEFPYLLFTEDREPYRGIIVSKRRPDDEIYRYLNFQDTELVHKDGSYWVFDVVAYLSNGAKIVLLTKIAKDESAKTAFENLAAIIMSVLRRPEYSRMFVNSYRQEEVDRVVVEMDQHIPVQRLIQKLVNNIPLVERECSEIGNVLYKMGFDEMDLYRFHQSMEYENPVHLGMVLHMLISSKNNVLLPFTQNHKKRSKEVEQIIHEWANEWVTVLVQTMKNHENQSIHP